jgi:hypothetical protein
VTVPSGYGFETRPCAHCGRAIVVVSLGRVDVCSYCGSHPDAAVTASVTAAIEGALPPEVPVDGDVADAPGLEPADRGRSSNQESDGVEAARKRRLPNTASEEGPGVGTATTGLRRFGERASPETTPHGAPTRSLHLCDST